MTDYRYSQLEGQVTGQQQFIELDLNKIKKLDKLLTKIDNDFKKKQKDITKPKLIEIMKTTHEIYQIVLYEISEMLEAAHLSDLRQSLNKIYNGQNIILNYILKLNTNFEVQADKMLENLQKTIQNPRRKSVDQSEVENRETNKMATQMVQLQPIVKKMIRKTYAEKMTDTGDDMKDARNKDNLKQKEKELYEMQEEIDEEGKQIAEFLKARKAEVLAMGESKAQNNLKEVLKDLGKKKRETNDIEEEALGFEDMQNKQNEQMKNLESTLMDGIKGMQKQAQDKAKDDIKNGKALMKNGVLVYMEAKGLQTDKLPAETQYQDKLDRQKREAGEKDQKLLMMEKKVKDIQIERDAYATQMSNLNTQISKLSLEKKKLEDKQNEEKKNKEKQQAIQQAVISKTDSEKIKRVVEENIKMKLRIRNLVDNVAALEKEMNRNFERFKLFIMNSALTDEQKKVILGQADNLFRLNITDKLNIQEMKEILAVDELLKDPLFKQICGADLLQMTKNVKKDELIRKQKISKIPNYDPLFDPEFLNPDEKIIVRRVKKIIQKQNSKGEWFDEEIEVDEEIVVNADGVELRSRDKPIVVQQSKETQQFMDAHGGFAIGGSKINLPVKPLTKDGKEAKLGEWFEDSNGKKVRKMQGKDGEDTYEIEEEYIDEYGQKKIRTKQMKIKKDRNGNEIVEEEFIGNDGKRQKVAKRVTKDKDGNDIVEEIIVDEFGNKVTKKQKIYKDKEGNEIIEEEIIDSKGNKQTIRKKIYRDENGNEVIVEEKIDAKGNKIITTKRKNEYGQEVVEQQIVDKYGRIQTVEKKAYQDENGDNVVEEVMIDAKGNKIIKKTKIRKDAYGNDVIEEEILNADGTITVKTQKKIKNKDGSETIEEELVDQYGNVTVVKKKIYRDKNGNIITEEEHVDPLTGKTTITKTIKDAQGRQTVQKKVIMADGTVTNFEKKVQQDQEGNQIETEVIVDDQGKQITVQRKIFKDKDGIEIKEEILVDENGNKKTVRTKIIKDKDGNDIIEETITNADGTKTTIKKKVYKDKDGNEFTEIETLDSNGNRVVIKTKISKNGEQIVEETKINADGKIEKTIKKIKTDKEGHQIVEETKINSDGTKTFKVIRSGTDDKQIQTDGQYGGEKLGLDQILIQLADLGIEKSKLEQIRNWISMKQQISNKKQQKMQQSLLPEEQTEEHFRPASAESQKSLDTLDDEEENDQQQADKLYNKMISNKSGGMAELLRQVRNGLGKQGNEQISQEEFREYMIKMRSVHQKCGDNCPHLRRFYEKLGYIQKKYKRRFLKMKDTRIEAKTKLPYLQNFSTINK